MIRKGFLFNINKCVGCHACVVACSVENQTVPEIQWREITSFNPAGYPDLPLFHYSLACNHCQDAPCMENCPALAYSKDKTTGAIVLRSERCMGCKYCTWACPYDAPKFNSQKGIIEKCTFCNHRLGNSLKPACANLCPTGALDFIELPDGIENSNIPGFTEVGINPSIQIVAPSKNKSALICSEEQLITGPSLKKGTDSKIKLSQEWPLAAFTLITMLMVSLFTANQFKNIRIYPEVFVGAAVIAMILSLLHLGKKFRAWRSVLNLKNSWLSREILAFVLFAGLSCLSLFYINDKKVAQAAVVFGIIALFSIDRVYQIAVQPVKLEIHSAHVFLSFFLFTALFLEAYFAFAAIALIKAALYTYRKLEMRKMKKNFRMFLSAWRLDMLVSFPFFFWIFNFSNIQWWIFTSILIGEIIDRAEYYDELDVITPQKQIEKDFSTTN